MSRFLLSAMLGFGLIGSGYAQQSDADKLQGTWEITALVDDGVLLSDELLRSRYAQDGRFIISGQTISFVAPNTSQKRTLLFVSDEKTSPKTFDLAGAEKVGGKGIYLLSDDVLMLCLAEPGSDARPMEFSAKKGSPHLLMTLKRVKGTAINPAQPPPKEIAPVQRPDDDLRKALIGTWGHQNDEWTTMFTVNVDGTFSSERKYRKTFGKLFNEDVRSSGNWKLQDGVVLVTITASTDREMRNQIYSYRIRTINANELIAVDQFGALRREWKAR